MNNGKNKIITAGIIGLIVGTWVFFSPFILGVKGTGFATSAYWSGFIIFALSLIELSMPESYTWAAWINMLFGLLILVSPFFFSGIGSAEIWSNVISGLVVAIISLWSFSATYVLPPKTRTQ